MKIRNKKTEKNEWVFFRKKDVRHRYNYLCQAFCGSRTTDVNLLP